MGIIIRYISILSCFAILIGTSFSLQAQEAPAKESIKVHGDWTITVKNQEGEIVEKREFSNELTDLGADFLTEIMNSEYSMGNWSIQTTAGTGNSSICEDSDGNGVQCEILEEPNLGNPNEFPNLTLETPDSGNNANALVLSGSLTAAKQGSINEVSTGAFGCSTSTAPENCTNSGVVAVGSFTTKTLDSSVSVAASQQVTITVVISFS